MSIHLRCVYSRAYRVLWGWKEDKTRDSSSPWQNPCGCRTSWVLSLPRWCIAMKSLHSLWNRDNTSWPNLNYRVDVLVKRSTLCENAMTYKITWLILLSLSYFPSFSLISSLGSTWHVKHVPKQALPFPTLLPFNFYILRWKLLHDLTCEKAYSFLHLSKHIHYQFLCCSLVYP